MRILRIDLNADVGELPEGDAELIPLVTSVNVAAGFHAGDAATIERTCALAARCGSAIGAHPGYPDREGFGRRPMAMSAADIESMVLYQVAAVAAFARDAGADLRHVKAHGALYNLAAADGAVADAVARAVRRYSAGLILVGLAGSALIASGRDAGLAVAEEAFADRAYEADGSLRSRALPGAVLDAPEAAAAQALDIVNGRLTAYDGSPLAIRADTLCVHGDLPGAAARAAAVRAALEQAGVELRALG